MAIGSRSLTLSGASLGEPGQRASCIHEQGLGKRGSSSPTACCSERGAMCGAMEGPALMVRQKRKSRPNSRARSTSLDYGCAFWAAWHHSNRRTSSSAISASCAQSTPWLHETRDLQLSHHTKPFKGNETASKSRNKLQEDPLGTCSSARRTWRQAKWKSDTADRVRL